MSQADLCCGLLGRGLLGFGRSSLLWCCLGLSRTCGGLLLAHTARAGLLEDGRDILDGGGGLLGLGGLCLGSPLGGGVGLGLRGSLGLGGCLRLGCLWCGLLRGGLRLSNLRLGLGLLLLPIVSDAQWQYMLEAHLRSSSLLLSRLLLGQLDGAGGTLGLGEVALLNTRLQSLVEQGVELSLGSGGDLVVGLYVFLDALTAVRLSDYERER
jgi:hypothetical protein